MMQAIEHDELPKPPDPHDPRNFDVNERGPQSENPPELPDDEPEEE